MGECWGADWETIATHTRFISNLDENSARFWLGGLKRLEMLLAPQVHVPRRFLDANPAQPVSFFPLPLLRRLRENSPVQKSSTDVRHSGRARQR
jgi:hypothetical protein